MSFYLELTFLAEKKKKLETEINNSTAHKI